MALREQDEGITTAEAELAGPARVASGSATAYADSGKDPHRGGGARFAEGLHIIEALIRSPWALATLLEAAGPGAEEQVGKIRARRQRE